MSHRKVWLVILLPAAWAVWMSATASDITWVMFVCFVLVAFTPVWVILAFAKTNSRRQTVSVLTALLVSLSVMVSVAVIHWPLRVSYALARPSFDRLAARLQAGESVSGWQWCGLVTVKKAEVNHRGIVCLWTGVLNPAGRTGFVLCGPTNIPFHAWSVISMDDRWQFITED
jgi:hypothetical protein